MKILITGASSYLGARMYFDLKNKHAVTGTYSSNRLSKEFVHLDVTDKSQVNKLIKKLKPDIVIHAANNASSKWCKENPKKAVLLNQTSTTYIVNVVNEIGSKLIYISSLAAVSPTNLYGETKLASEKITKKTKLDYLILRPSLILGYSPNTSNDRPFNRILKNLDKGTHAVYENAWNFQPTYIGHISEIIEGCIKKGVWNETISIVIPEVTTRYDTAKDILYPFGVKVEVEKTVKPYFKDFEVKLDSMKKHGLPTYTYKEMIKKIISEIKNRSNFKL